MAVYLKYQVINAQSLCYRKQPSLKGKVVGYFHAGDKITVVKGWSKVADGIKWFKLKSNNNHYYVSSKYLKRITPNYLEKVTKLEEIVYNKIVEIGCKHKGGAYSYEEIKSKKITNCASAVSAVLQDAGVLKKGKLINHTPKKKYKITLSQSISGTSDLISGTYRIVKVNRLYKDIKPEYNKKGIVYVYDSNVAINAGDGYIYSCNNAPSQLKDGRYIKNKMKGGYCFTSKILYAIIPND